MCWLTGMVLQLDHGEETLLGKPWQESGPSSESTMWGVPACHCAPGLQRFDVVTGPVMGLGEAR